MCSRYDVADGPTVGATSFHPGAAIVIEDNRYTYPNIPTGRDPYDTALSVRWDNVGKIGDRWVRVFMTIYDMDYIPYGTSSSYHPCLIIYKDFWYGLWMKNISNISCVYRFYYMDTGARVNMTNNYATWCSLNVGEGVTMNYDGTVDGYISDDSLVAWRGSYYGSTSNSFDDYIGGPTLYKSGITFRVPTRDVDVRLYGVGSSWIKPDFTSIFATIPEPEKSVDNERARLGDDLTFTVDQKLSGVTIYKYNALAIEDTLPEEVDYVSSVVKYKVGGSVRNLTKGSEYTETISGRLLKITFTPSFVSNLKYSDESLQLVISTKVNQKAMSKESITNQAITTCNTSRFVTNITTTLVDKYKITTSHEGEGTITDSMENIPAGENRSVTYTPSEGWYLEKILVDDVDKGTTYPTKYDFNNIQADHKLHAIFKPYHKVTTEVVNGTISSGSNTIKTGEDCEVTYSPNTGYYLKYIEVDGTKIDIKSVMSKYKFSNITEDHHIKVVYAKIPELTITKTVDKENVTWDKGYPHFAFRIIGTDYLGNAHTYYKSIKFSETGGNTKSITFKIPAGTYTVNEIICNEYILQKVENVSNFTISGVTGNCDLRDVDSAKIKFTNKFSDYSTYTENNDRVNKLK